MQLNAGLKDQMVLDGYQGERSFCRDAPTVVNDGDLVKMVHRTCTWGHLINCVMAIWVGFSVARGGLLPFWLPEPQNSS